ncbi:DUF423 domain-containing protein [Thiohalorhabdus sp. Cl-TMA]|uniref:DUF423 domain-containing protein n=1 Tax=Thiohalorhabdus methylotrophus TaxID=3242694 RepID=A0ABV4TVM0_9GAMM
MPVGHKFLILGAANAAVAVILGAFAAHGLRGKLGERMLEVFHTGVEYHFYHALGLILVGVVVLTLGPLPWLRAAGWVMLAGILIFAGTLYGLALGGPGWLGAITPLGGTAFILSWILFALAVWRAP